MTAQHSQSMRTGTDSLCGTTPGTENTARTTKNSEPAPALQSSKVFWNVRLRRCPADAVGVFLRVYFSGNNQEKGHQPLQGRDFCGSTSVWGPRVQHLQIQKWKRRNAGDMRRALSPYPVHFPAVRTSPLDCRVPVALTDDIPEGRL